MQRTVIGVAMALMAAAPAAGKADDLPDLAIPAADLGDERKFVLFHKPGVSEAEAAADLSFCFAFLPHGMQRSVPGFVPWRQADPARPVPYDGGQFGLVGAVIGAIIAGPLERSIRQSRLYRCMLPRGYDRYRTSEELWKQLNTGDPAQSIRVQARIASGLVPPTPKVTQ